MGGGAPAARMVASGSKEAADARSLKGLPGAEESSERSRVEAAAGGVGIEEGLSSAATVGATGAVLEVAGDPLEV